MAVVLLYLVLVVAAQSARAQEVCRTDGIDLCKCTTDSGLTLDLRKLGLDYPAQVTSGAYQYTYTPCNTQQCGAGDPSAACQEAVANEFYYSLGRYVDFSWTVGNSNPDNLNFIVSYGGGDIASGTARTTVVEFNKVSSQDNTAFNFVVQTELLYQFSVNGKGVAPVPTGGGGGGSSGGTIAGPIGLVIIFLALGALVAYFIVGGVYLYKWQGARGMEVIPQYTFWKGLPFLIKDGFFFTISPCYKREGKYQGI